MSTSTSTGAPGWRGAVLTNRECLQIAVQTDNYETRQHTAEANINFLENETVPRQRDTRKPDRWGPHRASFQKMPGTESEATDELQLQQLATPLLCQMAVQS